jgi:hypothetical protein
MPLGIELAAAWLKMVPCSQIAREIERSLQFLTTRARDVPERQRSVQAVFEHAWQLLSPQEQDMFKQLALFPGGVDRKAAEAVAGASLLALAVFAEKSLLYGIEDGPTTFKPPGSGPSSNARSRWWIESWIVSTASSKFAATIKKALNSLSV